MGVGGVLVIGSSNTDLVCRTPRLPSPGETVRGVSFATHAGGKGANQAVAAARAGAQVTFAGAVGDDAFGTARLADLHAEGIDVSHVTVQRGVASGVAAILVDALGENVIVLVPGANDTVTPEDALLVLAARQPRVLSLTHEIPFETVAAAINGKQGGTIVVHNAAPFDARVNKLISRIDVLICNEIEAAALLGRAVSAETGTSDVLALRDLGCGCAVITFGAAGAFVADSKGTARVPAPCVEVVDTTGAGDALCGVVAAWLANGSSFGEAVFAGVCAGSLAVTKHGAQPSMPRYADIAALMREQRSR